MCQCVTSPVTRYGKTHAKVATNVSKIILLRAFNNTRINYIINLKYTYIPSFCVYNAIALGKVDQDFFFLLHNRLSKIPVIRSYIMQYKKKINIHFFLAYEVNCKVEMGKLLRHIYSINFSVNLYIFYINSK